jgi:hypothetical protein
MNGQANATNLNRGTRQTLRRMQNPVLKSLSLRQMAAVASTAIDSIKINSITREMRRGRPMWVKRRRTGSELIALAAYLFSWLGRSPIRVWINAEKWQRWELGCFNLLHHYTLQAFAKGSRTVCEDEVPGRSLLEHVNRGTLKPRMLEAAARELRRVHEFWCEELGDHWSHGDPHLDNVIYDRAADRARLIDFEVIHDKSIPALLRHADDLLVFLQDLMGRVTAGQWLHFRPFLYRRVRSAGSGDRATKTSLCSRRRRRAVVEIAHPIFGTRRAHPTSQFAAGDTKPERQ